MWALSQQVRGLQDSGLLPRHPPPAIGVGFEDFRRALRETRPHLLWFAGHGDAALPDGKPTLAFSGAGGQLETFDPISVAQELKHHLPLYGGCLECVVLNACCTGDGPVGEPRLGDLLKAMGAPSVVCWATPADNAACAHFARGFGTALREPTASFADAFGHAEREVRAQKMPSSSQEGVLTQRCVGEVDQLIGEVDQLRLRLTYGGGHPLLTGMSCSTPARRGSCRWPRSARAPRRVRCCSACATARAPAGSPPACRGFSRTPRASRRAARTRRRPRSAHPPADGAARGVSSAWRPCCCRCCSPLPSAAAAA